MSELPTRSHSHEISIKAPVEAVWQALTDSAQLTRWYVEEAEVDPKQGGRYWVSWGHGQEGMSEIETFEPNRKLRLALQPWTPTEGSCGGGASTQPEKPIIEEFVLSSQGESTVLRLVNSGIPDAPDWNGFYDGTDGGWDQFLRQLRHYLEHHFGTPRQTLTLMQKVPSQAWESLTGPGGLCAEGTLADLASGQPYQVKTALGESLSGVVSFNKPPHVIELTVREYQNAYLSISFAGGGTLAWVSLSTFGLPAGKAEELQARWQGWLAELWPASETVS